MCLSAASAVPTLSASNGALLAGSPILGAVSWNGTSAAPKGAAPKRARNERRERASGVFMVERHYHKKAKMISTAVGRERARCRPPELGRDRRRAPLRGLCSDGGGHGAEELGVGFGFGEAAQEELHGFNGRERAQDFAEDPDAAKLVGREQELVLARAGALNVNGREDALIGETPVEIDFHVAGALELFEDDVVHAAARVNQRGGDDGERAAFFDVARGGEEAPRALEGVGVNTAGKDFAGGRRDGVVGAGDRKSVV